ncbi:E3 ubiquitin-protein ligase Bre1 [Procambarus clarkii]|uniref:E3 ubiquitin-protein ligase Bre1 n=1 Tax=Procambarus clarkii TaxID=6728 RepID=UPI001E673C5A|nr:E3 ubiquitin-protein ligase Bre1-like [Procambarus clarkii]XP_045610582.1 E3 ubiquitin-protein ligase Bre1-like [Procambarus clarkii]
MSKRALDEGGSSSAPPTKNLKVQFEPIQLGSISTLDEMDMKTLRFQNHKLYQRLEQRKRIEDELRSRIEQLEKRQTQSDDVLTVINRYWNQFNEDIRLMLQRFDAETADEAETRNESEATTSFLTQLSTWDREELDEKLVNRVQVSKRAVAKIVQAFDRLHQRNEKVARALKGEGLEGEPPPVLEESVRELNSELQTENKNLHAQNLSFHEKHHLMCLKVAELEEKLQAMDTEKAEMQNRFEDMEYDLNKTRSRCEKVESHLADTCQKLKAMQDECGVNPTGNAKGGEVLPGGGKITSSISSKKMEELNSELEELRELSAKRLDELEKKTNEHKEALKEVERLKMDLRQLPESVIVETTEYKCLQSQFSVLYNDSMQLKTQLEETRHQLQNSKNAHLRQIEQMESEELTIQKKLRAEVIQLEDMQAQVRKEYEMLRIEFEQNLAANEQTGPINREMRHLITSLQNHITQLKGEIHRYKRKYKESATESSKLKREVEDLHQKLAVRQRSASVSERQDSVSSDRGDGGKEQMVKEEGSESCDSSGPPTSSNLQSNMPSGGGAGGDDKTAEGMDIKKEDGDEESKDNEDGDKKDDKIKKEIKKEGKDGKDGGGGKQGGAAAPAKDSRESEIIRNLKSEHKKAVNDYRELKLLLDMYKGVGKEQRDKVQLMAAEKKARQEVEDLKAQVKKLQESKREERKKLADEEAIRKIKQLEESVHQLQRQVAVQKQEEETLLNEMEVTGQAFEDMQEQNIRLIQQLREKDDANFKLMSERIKSNQIHQLANEERNVLQEQTNTLTTQVEAQNQVVRKLEEKERLLQNNLTTVEKELTLRQQALEMHKRKAIESAQSAADLKLHLEKYHAQMKEAQQVVAEKTMALEQEAFKYRRVQEEIASLRRKVERAKKFEMVDRADEVLMEEIRDYKDTLTCPSCKVKRKDAVLVKCFHVFCFDCLRTRYETRQRKCPKCNAAFGANDYHRLYLT